MWEKLTKVSIQNFIAVLVILLSYGLLYLLVYKEVPARNEKLLDILIGAVIGATITAVIGWLYTQSKIHKPPVQ
jgi:hypothetical protein